MKYFRFFCFIITLLFVFLFTEKQGETQTYTFNPSDYFPVEYRQNGVNRQGFIQGDHEWFGTNNNCFYHRTSLFNSFAHVHVDAPYPFVSYIPIIDPFTNEISMYPEHIFTMSDIKAYWDYFFDNGADERDNMANISTYGGENVTQNCRILPTNNRRCKPLAYLSSILAETALI